MKPEAEAPRGRRPSRRTLTIIVVPIFVLFALGWIGNAMHPALIKEDGGHPLLLIALEPRNRWLILTADRIDFVPFLVVAVFRRLLSDPLFYLLGYLYGDGAVAWAERKFDPQKLFVRRMERWYRKAAPVMVFFFPGALVCTLAGATGMNPALFAACNVAGTIAMVTALYFVAGLIEGPVDAITGFYSDNFKWLLIFSIGMTVLFVIQQRRQGRSEIESIDQLEAELQQGSEG